MNIRSLTAVLALGAAALACADDAPARRAEPSRNADRTVFASHRQVTFDAAKENAVWCATFQMAWDALGRDVLEGAPDLGPPAAPAFVDAMNAGAFPAKALDEKARVVVAGRKRDGVLERIAREGREKFGRELPEVSISLARPDDVLAYCFLAKQLPFEHPFEAIDGGIAFPGATTPVAAWGLNPGDAKKGLAERLAQVRILFDGKSGEGSDSKPQPTRGLVIEVAPKGGRDRVLLAQLAQPPADLAKAWGTVQELVKAGTPRSPKAGTVLKVPRLHFDLLHHYSEIEGAAVRNKGADGLVVAQALQSVLFRLDETGAKLESEAGIALKADDEEPDRFVFDRPFLVALLERGAEEPYFLLWVADPALFGKP